MRTLVPEPGTALRVVTDSGAVLDAVVRAARDAVLEVETPPVQHLHQVPLQRDAEGTAHWGRADAEYRARVRLVEAGERHLQLRLSEAWARVQRREHVRARYAAQLSVVDLDGKRWHGATIDVSESGVRCRIEQRARLKVHDRLMVSLQLDEQRFDMAGEVQWVTAGDEWHHEAGLRFLDPGPQGDAIRGWVFAFQIRSRELR